MRGIGLVGQKSYTSHRQKYECLFELAEFIVAVFIAILSHCLPLLRYYKLRPLVATIAGCPEEKYGYNLKP